MNKEEIHQQIFDALERDDIHSLKILLEPPLNVDTIVLFYFLLLFSIFFINT